VSSLLRSSGIWATAASLALLSCSSRPPLVVNQDAAGTGGSGPGTPGDAGHGGGGGGGDVAGGAGGPGGSSGGGGIATGTGGGAAGTGGSSGGGGGAAGTGGTGGAGGAGGGGPCTVTTAAGTTVACTERLLASHQQNLYCGLKAGQVRCWADQNFYQSILAPAVAQTPPGLVQLSIAENASSDPFFCGVDARGSGTCWGPKTMVYLGGDVASTAISRYGPCAVFKDGHVKCTNLGGGLPLGHRYVQLAISADYIIALDDTGTPVHTATNLQFPPGVYLKVGITTGAIGAALQDDGALVYLMRPEPKVVAGSFVDFALDYDGHLCGIDTAGEITCFTFADGRPPAPSPPPGPFIQIAGGTSTFCGLRPSGTTTCWGDVAVPVPDGW